MFVGHNGGVIDHCHETGEIRGILCSPCNIIVGNIELHEDVSKVIEYLGL